MRSWCSNGVSCNEAAFHEKRFLKTVKNCRNANTQSAIPLLPPRSIVKDLKAFALILENGWGENERVSVDWRFDDRNHDFFFGRLCRSASFSSDEIKIKRAIIRDESGEASSEISSRGGNLKNKESAKTTTIRGRRG